MKITYLGHSAFKFETSNASAVIDPYDGQVGYKMPNVTADVLLNSHKHFDHNYNKLVSGYSLFYAEEEVHTSFLDLTIEGLMTFHDDCQGAKRGRNAIYSLGDGSVKVAHMGDFGESTIAPYVDALKGIDVLLIPVGGTFTLDAKGAKQVVDALSPKLVIPMHYHTSDCKFPTQDVEAFTSLFPSSCVTFSQSNTITVDESIAQNPHTRICVLRK